MIWYYLVRDNLFVSGLDWGTIISFILGYIALFWSETAMAVIILPGVVVGLGFMLYGQFKYNKGIF